MRQLPESKNVCMGVLPKQYLPECGRAHCTLPASHPDQSVTARARVELFAKGHAVELILDRAMETLTDAVGLRS